MSVHPPLRVLLLAPHPFFQHRGTPLAERALLEALSSRGYHLEVLTFHEGEDISIPNCTIHRIPRIPGVTNIRPGFSLKKLVCDGVMLIRLVSLLRKRDFDVIHAVEESAFMAMFVKVLFRTPFVYDMDSSLAHQMIDRFPVLAAAEGLLAAWEKRAVRRSLAVVAVCQALEELALRYDPDADVRRIEDFSLLPRSTGKADDLAAIGVRGSIVLYVGNLEAYQGIDLLLRGFARVLERAPDARLVVIGGSDEHIAHYSEIARTLNISARVHFAGPRPVDALAGYLRQAEVVVSPRTQGQNTPMKVYSYLDSGRPLLATRLPTHTQVLDDDIAMLVDPDPVSVGDGLVALLRNPELRERLATAAGRRVEEEFSEPSFRAKVGDLYDLVENRLGRPDSGGPPT